MKREARAFRKVAGHFLSRALGERQHDVAQSQADEEVKFERDQLVLELSQLKTTL